MSLSKEVQITNKTGKIIPCRSITDAAAQLGVTRAAVKKAIRKGSFVKGEYLISFIDPIETEETITKTDPNNYPSLLPSAWDAEKNRFLSIEEFCSKYGLPFDTVKSSKLVSHNQTHMTYNIVFYTEEEKVFKLMEEDLEEIIQNHLKGVSIKNTKLFPKQQWTDRLVFTDVHIAMDVNDDGDPLYDGKWDSEELHSRLDQMLSTVLTFKTSNEIVIDELGDFLDGLNGYTARREHSLPQNMNSKEAFEQALEFKLELLERLLEQYDYVTFHNVVEDNHAAVFGYFVASAFKKVAEAKYPDRVKVVLCKRFMNHYKLGNHTFILSHGKDSKTLKFGFKPFLDAKQAEKIDQYCKEHKLYDGNHIEFSKGDSHQAVMDYTTSNDFDYCNYPSFAPPSNWVKTNFKNSHSGFFFYNIDKKSNMKRIIPYFFKC